ncbi:MAG: RnfABCDGE type electron transport complex subunit D [Victivallaceae bacterium]|nr:RnfABCDGE type electron transport complex subunit D [Victivallaceae bacterium]
MGINDRVQEKSSVRLPDAKNLVLSSSPHLSSSADVRKIMLLVIFCMLPACGAGVWFFGLPALKVLLLSLFFCVGLEALWCFCAGKPVWGTIGDCSAAVTGILLALNLPPGVPFYVPLVGAALAIWLGKQIYGGLGNNPFNPVLVGRVGLLIALPALMTTWSPARGMAENYPEYQAFGMADPALAAGATSAPMELTTCATPLGVASTLPAPEAGKNRFEKIDNPSMWKEYFIGRQGGCIGETCAPALLLGGILLVIFNLINWRVPLYFAGTVFVLSGIVHFFFPQVTPTPLFHLLTGGLLLGAIFMATDMVTSPITGTGCLIFAVGCGIITTVIRIWGNYPEGVSFSILFMNALVPLIDRWFVKRPFGYTRRRREAK